MKKVQLALAMGVLSIAGVSQALANGPCCLPDGSCIVVRDIPDCTSLGGVVGTGGLTCDQWICPNAPRCGDGSVDSGEACDDGNTDNNDACRNDCTEPYCGDGITDSGEECDDGNTTGGDGCSATCQEEGDGGGEGCTPGYWKQSHHFDSWVGYVPSDNFDAVFGVTLFGSKTLLQVAASGGGGSIAMGRHAVAALLSASSGGVEFLYSVEQVINMVQDAVADGSFEATKNLFAAQNELGCPLN